MHRARMLIVAAAQLAAVILGALVGEVVHYPGRSPNFYTFMAVFAVLMVLLDQLARVPDCNRESDAGRKAIVRAGCLVYMIGAMLSEPFLHVDSVSAVTVAALVLVPLLLAFSYLVRSGAWVSAEGVILFVFTCSAMLAGNANVSDAGSGFVAWWIS